MTRPGKSPRGQTLSELFASDAEAAVLRVLREANAALNAIEVKKALHAGGVSTADADKAWRTVQKRVKTHDHVTAEGNRYRWTDEPRRISAMEAVELIAKGRLAAPQKAKLVAIVRAALEKPPVDLEAAARRRQAEIDAVRALAELAIEVEELTANQASARAMVHRVRAHVKLTNLEPIDRAGEEAAFNRKRHQPIGRPISDGTSVIVVRPGYVWKAPTEDVLIAKAVVQDRG